MDIFKKASKIKLRFQTSVGNLSVEDLWDLPLNVIDSLAIQLDKAINESPKVSFVNPTKSGVNPTVQLQFDIVKTVIETRLNDADVRAKAAATRAQKQKIMEIIAQKQDGELASKSIDELKAMMESGELDETMTEDRE